MYSVLRSVLMKLDQLYGIIDWRELCLNTFWVGVPRLLNTVSTTGLSSAGLGSHQYH